MSRAAFASETQVRKNFARCLKDALELGIMPPSDQGFHLETDRALRDLAQDYPNPDPSLVVAARRAFAEQWKTTPKNPDA